MSPKPWEEAKIKSQLYSLVAVLVVLIVIAIIVLVFVYYSMFAHNTSNTVTNTNPIVMTPTIAPTFLNSSLLDNTIPITMSPGQQYPVTIIARNTGDVPWSNDTIHIAQFINDSYDNTSFSTVSTMDSGTLIKSGINYTWKFSMTAPTWNGNYTIAYRMKNSSSWFGDILVKNITVGTPGANVDFTTLDIPSTMRVNSRINVTVVVTNLGKYPWYADEGAQLGINYSPNDGSSFTDKIRLQMNPDSGVMPGQSCKWKYPITAPSYPTQYNVTFQMMQGDEYFGAPVTKKVQIIN